MSHIFISHVEEDAEIAREIANGLEAAGYSTWYYQRDTVPGASYLIQVTQAIDQCKAVALLVSPNSIISSQVTKEVVHAFEKDKLFFPVLHGISHLEFQERQPEWRHALGSSASVNIGPEGASACASRIIDGLKALGIQPEASRPLTVATELAPASYTPKHLADKIIAARPSIEGERKQVTVLFADVTGFTSSTEKLDPEEAQDFIGQCVKFITDEIHHYEGTVAQFLGNGAMALFGVLIAHEDAPQRALYAALGIRERLEGYTEQLKIQGVEFAWHIGVNTGLLVVSRIADDLTMEYTPVGDTIDLALEMNHVAESGSIEVTDNTHSLTEGYFEFKPLGDVQVRDRKEPIKAYRVLGLGAVRTRLAASIVRGLTQFVGRKKELEHLSDCFDRVKEGQGQVVGIVGEAGVGKSRLLLEFRSALTGDEYTYLEGRCLHYGEAIAYLPLLDILRSYFDVKEGEQESVIKSKMAKKIDQLDEKIRGILPPLHEILSLKVDDKEYLKLEPQQRRERTFEAIRTLLIREGQERSLVLAVEDLHWIDRTSGEFLNYLIGGLANAHILLILLYRPEYTHNWGSKSYYSGINVDDLPSNTSAELVQSILEEGEIVPELRELIIGRAGGNPLFVEEFTHTLVENGSIQKEDHQYVLSRKPSDIQVPDTVQGIISARMDRLEENLKRTMQVASVIGRDFAYRILHIITGMREELKSYLLNLQGLEFIYEKSLLPELEYIFKHALTQEVAYNSLLLKRRREIHERIGKAIEELYPDRLEEFYEMLAHHYSKSENLEKAYQYLKLSGEKASHSYSNWEAFRFYKEAINVLNKLPETEENKRRGIEVRLLSANTMRVLGYPEDSLQILQDGERLSIELGHERSLAIFYSNMGLYHTIKGDPGKGIKYAENCFIEAQKIQDVELMAPIGFDLCTAYMPPGQFFKTVEVAPRVISLLEAMERQSDCFGKGFNVYSVLLTYNGQAMAWLGDFEDGEPLCEKGLRFALEIRDLLSLTIIEQTYGFLYNLRGDGENSVTHFQNGIAYCAEGQVVILSGLLNSGVSWAYYLLGEVQTARKYAENAIRIQRDAEIPFFLSFPYYVLSMIYLDSGDLKNARSSVSQALEQAQINNEKWVESNSWILLGRILGKAEPRLCDDPEKCILRGIRTLKKLRIKPQYSIGYLFLGELFADAGQRGRALETLKKAEGMFQEMGMDYWLRRTQEVLERVQV